MPQPWSASGSAAASALVIHAGMSAERSFWNSAGPSAASIVAAVLRGHVVLAEIPEGGERGALRLTGELKPPAVRGVDHPDGDVADPDGAARCAGMEHGRGRHLGAELEPPRGFGAVDLDRLTIAARDGLDHLEDVGEDGSHEAACPRADEDAAGETLDLAPADEARKRPVDGAARAVSQKALVGEGLSLRQLAYAGLERLVRWTWHDASLSENIVIFWTSFKGRMLRAGRGFSASWCHPARVPRRAWTSPQARSSPRARIRASR